MHANDTIFVAFGAGQIELYSGLPWLKERYALADCNRADVEVIAIDQPHDLSL